MVGPPSPAGFSLCLLSLSPSLSPSPSLSLYLTTLRPRPDPALVNNQQQSHEASILALFILFRFSPGGVGVALTTSQRPCRRPHPSHRLRRPAARRRHHHHRAGSVGWRCQLSMPGRRTRLGWCSRCLATYNGFTIDLVHRSLHALTDAVTTAQCRAAGFAWHCCDWAVTGL